MEGLTLTTKEQNRLQILNGVLEKYWLMREAAKVMGVSERQAGEFCQRIERKALLLSPTATEAAHQPTSRL